MAWTTPRTWVSGELVTAAIMNSAIRFNLEILKTPINDSGRLEFTDAEELTIASGVITVTQNYHKVDTESSAASDDLDTITTGTNVAAGFILHLRVEDAARTVVIKNGTGGADNLDIGADVTLDESYKTYSLVYDGSNWRPWTFAEAATFASVSPLTTRGDVLYASSGVVTGTRLAVGATGTLLGSDGTDVSWVAGTTQTIVQIVTGTVASAATSSSSTFADFGLTASITPSSTDNHVLVIAAIGGVYQSYSAGRCNTRLMRDASVIAGESGAGQGPTGAAGNFIGSVVLQIDDSPSSTAELVYKCQFAASGNAGTAGVSANNSTCTIFLIEIVV